jgi:hypothetical protein
MNAMNAIRSALEPRSVRAIGIAACLLLSGCKDDGPTAPAARPTPIPVPVPNVAGTWHGTYRPGAPAPLCGSDIPASATFFQDGASVSGRLITEGVTPVSSSIQGELRGNQLHATLTTNGRSVSLTGSATTGRMSLTAGSTSFFCQNVRLFLER